MTTQKIWKEAYSETVLDFTERNPDPADWVRGERTDEAQRMRDALTADISEIPAGDLVTIDVEIWKGRFNFLDGGDSIASASSKQLRAHYSKKHCYHKPK